MKNIKQELEQLKLTVSQMSSDISDIKQLLSAIAPLFRENSKSLDKLSSASWKMHAMENDVQHINITLNKMNNSIDRIPKRTFGAPF